MKRKLALILFAVFSISIHAQDINFINNTSNHKKNIPDFRKDISKNNLNTKSVTWNWDTIITFDSLNNNYQRAIRTFDANGNLLTSSYQEWLANTWFYYPLQIYTYDINGNILTHVDGYYRYSYSYNINNNETSCLKEIWQSNSWLNINKDTLLYDINGYLITWLTQVWQSNTWVNSQKVTYNHDANGNVITRLLENWDVSNYIWIQYSIENLTYDSNNHMLTDLYVDPTDSAKWTFTYDLNGNIQTCIYEDSHLVNNERHTYTYNANNNMLTDLKEMWDYWGSSWAWDTVNRITYTYNNYGKLLTEFGEGFNGFSGPSGFWENDYRATYNYDNNGNLLIKLIESWDFWHNVFSNFCKMTYTFDSNNNSLTGMYEEWSSGNWNPSQHVGCYNSYSLDIFSNQINTVSLECIHRYIICFTSFNSLNIETKQNIRTDISVYPNPATETINISNARKGEIHIYTLLGEEIIQTKCKEGENTINVSLLQKGNYLLKITCKEKIIVKKITIY